MVFFNRGNSASLSFTYDGDLSLNIITLELLLHLMEAMLTAAEKMADNFRSAIARVYRIGDRKGIKHRKHAMLWLFQVFALTAGLYGRQVWATSSLTHDFWKIITTHVFYPGFPEKTLGCQERYWYSLRAPRNRSDAHFFLLVQMHSGTVYSLQTTLFLRKLCGLIYFLQTEGIHWTYQVLHALQDLPTSHQFLDAIRSRQTINLGQFELTLREHIIGGWRDLDILTPRDNHHSSRIMRTYHTHFGVPLGIAPGWWDDRKEITSLCYRWSTFAWIFPPISAVHFLAFAFLAITFWSKECVITGIGGLMSPGSVTNVTVCTLFRMRNTFCWTVRMNILLAFAHSTASWSFHLKMEIAQLVWGLFWTNQIFMVWPLLWLSA